METAPAESHASMLRQRMLSRASTIAEGVQPSSPTLSRRRSSLFSNHSDAQHSYRSSTDNLVRSAGSNDMDTLTSSDDPSWWHSGPVLIAIVPAVAALTHPSGGTLATDIVLIVLSAWFMSKCVAVPWEWYHEARQRQYIDTGEPLYHDTIYEEDEEGMSASPERPGSATSTAEESKSTAGMTPTPKVSDAYESARAELRRTEMMAFAACFLGPLLGAYLLHTIRSQFTHRTRDGIVTDLNLTIYLLGAEMRPISRLMRMVNERTLHLQRVLKSEPRDQSRPATAQDLPQRLAELEARFDKPLSNSNNVDISKISAEVRQSMQHQLDALNRAVRKYEKRHMAQSIQIEARFQEIDVRLKDTLSLAAAAARTGQKPGIFATTVSWIVSVFTYGVQVAWDISLYPFRTVSSLIEIVASWLFNNGRNARKRTKGQLNGHSSIPTTSRMQSKSAR
jgi:hypothetical protein